MKIHYHRTVNTVCGELKKNPSLNWLSKKIIFSETRSCWVWKKEDPRVCEWNQCRVVWADWACFWNTPNLLYNRPRAEYRQDKHTERQSLLLGKLSSVIWIFFFLRAFLGVSSRLLVLCVVNCGVWSFFIVEDEQVEENFFVIEIIRFVWLLFSSSIFAA